MSPPQFSKKRLCDVHNMPKCMSCHKAILVITRAAHSSNDCIRSSMTVLPEIRSPLFNLYKFQDSSKSSAESCRIH